MNKKTKYDVFLTPEAIQYLKDDSTISSFLTNQKYFKCSEINPNGNYLFMKLEHPAKFEGNIIFEISIPHSFVLYIFSFDSDIHPSF
jgi:hypothetical protein